MLSLDDPKWKSLDGGYRAKYDASVPLKEMQAGQNVWAELWAELHHQGDVGIASYAAIPQIVNIAAISKIRDWNFYGLIATIEVERHRKSNPPLPEWLKVTYDAAWFQALQIAINDLNSKGDEQSSTLQAILAVLALAKGELKLGALIMGLDSSELDEYLEESVSWSKIYRD